MWSKLTQAMRRLSKCDPPQVEAIPPITLTDMEYRQLNVIAMVGVSHDAAASDRLHWELDRARIVPEKELASGTVRMGSIVTYRTDTGVTRTVRLVYGEQADGAAQVSILSPIGTALIGVAEGKTMPYSFEGERAGSLTVVSAS